MFKEGELVMYGNTGVCKIVKIGRPDFASDDDSKVYYILEPLFDNGTFYSPVDNNKVSIRKVISKKEAKKLIDSIGEIESEIFSTSSIQQLSQHYQSIIDKHCTRDLVSLAKSITEKETECQKNNKKLGQIDRRFMKKAEELLYGEFAAALGMDINSVEELIKSKLK